MIKKLNPISIEYLYQPKYFCVFLLMAAVTALFLPAMLGWRGVFHDDQAMEEFSRYYFVAQNLKRGIIPLWDPQTWCGAIPFYARYYADTYYLPLWPFYFFANLSNLDHAYWSFILLPLWLHYIWAAIGMFVLLRRLLKCGYISSWFGAIAYIYSPTFTHAYVWQQVVSIQAWLPWLIIIYVSAVEQWRLWKVGLGGLVLAFILTAGNPGIWHLVAFLWGGTVVFLTITQLCAGTGRGALRPLLIAILIGILGAGLSGVYLCSFFDGRQYTQEHIKLTTEAALSEVGGSLPPLFLATLFAPNLFDNITGTNMRFLNPTHDVFYWETNLSGGMAVSLLVMLGLVLMFKIPTTSLREQTQRRYVVLFSIIYLLALLCILGRHTPFYRNVIGYLPGIGQLPRPIRYRMLQCFAVAILAAVGLDDLLSLQIKFRLRFWIWVYMVFSSIVVLVGLMYPLRSKERVSHEWSQKPVFSVDGYFPSGYSICMYSPPRITRKIRVFFDGESAGEIRYANNNEVAINEGTFIANYYAPVKGWYEFNVNIPPHKYVWIYQEYGTAKIGYVRLGDPTDTFYYNTYDNKWIAYPYSNSIWFYQEIREVNSSLFTKLSDNKCTFRRLITTSVFYWLLCSFAIILGVYYLSFQKFGYLLFTSALVEVFVFGTLAFYGCTFSYDNPSSPRHLRALKPSVHPWIQRVVDQSLGMIAANSMLRIATDRIYYDNFIRIIGRFALMGYEMHPLESRFKRAIETAYGQAVGWSLYNTRQEPIYTSFLNHFSVGYFVNSNPNNIFLGGKSVSLSPNSGLYVYTNPNALPHAFTMDRLIIASEKDQLDQLVYGDLRRAVYISPSESIESLGSVVEYPSFSRGIEPPGSVIEEDVVSHFTSLQQANRILQLELDNPNRIDVDIEVNKPSMLVLTEVWYPGWEAKIDGRLTKVYRVNYCQRGVWLEKGRHEVRFRFWPLAWRWGASISLGTVVLLLLLFIVTVIKKQFLKKALS